MYEELSDEWLAVVNKAKESAWTNYSTKGRLILIDDWKYIVQDLVDKIKELEEEKIKIEKNIEDNYREIPVAEQVW